MKEMACAISLVSVLTIDDGHSEDHMGMDPVSLSKLLKIA